MTSATVALGVAAIVFAGGVVERSLQHALPEKYTTCGIVLVFVAEQGYRTRVPWCGPSSTAKAHTEKLGVRSDAAPVRDEPGLFIGPATNPELAQIACQTESRGCFKVRFNRTEPHGSVSWARMKIPAG
jgi:hypothetical protein